MITGKLITILLTHLNHPNGDHDHDHDLIGPPHHLIPPISSPFFAHVVNPETSSPKKNQLLPRQNMA